MMETAISNHSWVASVAVGVLMALRRVIPMTNRHRLNHTLARTRLSSDVDCVECAGVPEMGCVDCALRIKGVLLA
jgi:hypothetical protein